MLIKDLNILINDAVELVSILDKNNTPKNFKLKQKLTQLLEQDTTSHNINELVRFINENKELL